MFPDLVKWESMKELEDLILVPLQLQQSKVIKLRVLLVFSLSSLLPLLLETRGL